MIELRTFKFLITGIFFIILSSCSPIIYTSSWQSKDFSKITQSEWNEPFRFHDENSSLQYNISNDSTKIYICIKTSDLNDQYKIIRSGMQIWIDTLNKKKHQIGILFPFPHDSQIANNSSNNKILKKSGLNKQKKQFQSETESIHLIGFKPGIDSIISDKNAYGISVTINWDSTNTLYYKATIPFKTFYKERILSSDIEKVLTFSTIVNPLPVPNNQDEKNYKKEKMSEDSGDDDITKEERGTTGERKSFGGGRGSYGVTDPSNRNQHDINSNRNSSSTGEKLYDQKSVSPFEETSFSLKFHLCLTKREF